jgi:hypothetical protein
MSSSHGARKWKRIVALAAILGIAYGGGAVAYHWRNSSGPGKFPLKSGFESGDLGEWPDARSLQLCCEHSAEVVASPSRAGTHSLRMRLKRGDPQVEGSQRAELRTPAARMGESYLYRFRVRVPADWKNDRQALLAQWHGVPDRFLGEMHVPPPLRLSLKDDLIQFQSRSDDGRRVSRAFWDAGRTPDNEVVWSGPLERERWVDWAIEIRWSCGEDGRLQIWKDGTRVVDRTGPNTYNDAIAPYLKLGVYVPTWAPETDDLSVYFDEISAFEGEATFPEPFRAP